MKKVLFLGAFLCFCGSLNAQNIAKTFEIGGITVSGLKSSEKQAILALTGLRIGDKISIPGPATNKALKALWKQGLFSDIQILKEKEIGDVVFLEIRLIELPRLKSYKISGLDKNEALQLEAIAGKYLKKGTAVNEQEKIQLTKALESYYREKGFPEASVSINEKVDTNTNQLHLDIIPDKKAPTKIAAIHFKGNTVLSDNKLQKLIQTKSKACLLCKAQLIQSQWEADKKAILEHYNMLGYRDAKILKDRIRRDTNGDLHLNLSLEEGRRYFIRNIIWEGNSLYSDADLNKVFGIKKGDVFNQRRIEQQLYFDSNGRDISSIYMDMGYLFLQLEYFETAIRSDSIDIEIRIKEGPQATIGKVDIKGNDKTHEHVVRRELRTQPGQKFSRSAIIRSQREIINLGYFNPEKLGINTTVNPEQGTVDIEYSVEEQNSDKIELSAGWQPGTEDIPGGIVGTLGFSLNNFSFRKLLSGNWKGGLPAGDGQTLSMRIQSTGAGYQAYNLAITEPWLGGKSPTSLTLAGYFQRYTNNQPRGNENFESLSILGLSGIISKPLPWLNGNMISTTELTYKDIRLNKLQEILLEDGTNLTEGNFNNLYLKQTLTYNTLTDPFFPKKGVRISLSGQFTPPYSLLSGEKVEDKPLNEKYQWLEYHKWKFSADWYTPLNKNLVLRAKAKMGWLGGYNAALGAPPFERFEMGGNGWNGQQAGFTGNDILALRGYAEDYLDGSQNGGGAAFSKFTVELRYQVLNSPMSRAYLLAFVEGGNVWKQAGDFNPFDLKRSAGIGFRVHLPMFGTLGLDYGIGFDQPGINSKNWTKYGRFNLILGFEPE